MLTSPSRIVLWEHFGIELEARMKRNRDLLELAAIRRQARAGRARDARLQAGLSLAEVAAVIGVAPATVLRWETGQRKPRGLAALRYGRLCQELMGHNLGDGSDSAT